MGKTNKEKKAQRKKLTKVLMIIGYVICTVLLVTTIVTAIMVKKLNVLPTLLIVLLTLLIIVFTAMFAVTQRWLGVGIFTKILAIIMIVVMIVGCNYINVTKEALDKMTGVNTQVTNIHVYVLAEDPALDLQAAKDYNFGILRALDRENTDKVVSSIDSKLGKSITTTEYESVLELANALYNGEVKAIVLNSAYISILEEVDGFADFESRIRSISEEAIVEEVSSNNKGQVTEYDGDEVITIYISGVDSTGTPEVNSNSDVNILLTANLKTRQILIISTPRDFYVPLSISNGQKDKLTHAGGYGIDVSVDTLSMLYDVEIDDYVKVNFTGFIEIVDALGGVNVYSEYEFNSEHYHFNQGYNMVNGKEALEFARTRGAFEDGDRQRGKNQMAFIEAVINEMATSDMLKNYDQVLNAVSSSMITSMSYEEISNLVKFQLNDMRGWEVLKYSVNGFDSSNTTYSGGSQALYVMEPDMTTVEQARKYLDQMYAGQRITIQ